MHRYYADCTECFYRRVGINPDPVSAWGQEHERATGHVVEFGTQQRVDHVPQKVSQ